jgi:hypothetical protein
MFRRRFWKRVSLSIGAPLGNMGGSFYRELGEIVGGLWKRSNCVYGRSIRGNWKGGSFTGEPEGCVKEGSGNEHLSP